MLLRGRRGEAAAPGSVRSESPRGPWERARPQPRGVRDPAPPGLRGERPASVSVRSPRGACARRPCAPRPAPRWAAGLCAPRPPPSLPPSPALRARTPTTCAPEEPNSSRAPRGAGGRATPRRGPPPPPRRRLPSPPGLTLPPREGCLEGSGRPERKPRSASYDQLGVCLLLPRAQVGEQASVQNMSEGGDGQGRGVGEDHHQRGRHAT